MPAWLEVFGVFLRLGLGSFGGPLAHLGYFRREFVERRRWLSDAAYADLVALCQFLPGPASSQVGMALGRSRAGLPGALAAWAGFTLPSALALTAFALGLARFQVHADAAWLHGFKIAAVAVVAQALWAMGRSLGRGPERLALSAGVAAVCLLWTGPLAQLGALTAAALAGRAWLDAGPAPAMERPADPGHHGALWLGAYAGLLLLLPVAARLTLPGAALVDAYYRCGALVFGGGHVVLPLLQAEVVGRGWMDAPTFVAGYGAAQAVPGPLFSVAAFLGAAGVQAPHGWLGALLATVAVFLPSLLLIQGALPYWTLLAHRADLRRAMAGLQSGVLGLLAAALIQPVGSSALLHPTDWALAGLALLLLQTFKTPSWLVLILCALGATALASF